MGLKVEGSIGVNFWGGGGAGERQRLSLRFNLGPSRHGMVANESVKSFSSNVTSSGSGKFAVTPIQQFNGETILIREKPATHHS